MKDQKLLKTLIVIGLATTLAFSASAFVGCDNSKTQGGIVDPPIIVVDPPEPDKPIIEPDEPIIEPDDPVDEKPVDEPDEPDEPVIDEPDEPVIDEPDEPVIDEPDNPPDNPPEEEEQLTEAELKKTKIEFINMWRKPTTLAGKPTAEVILLKCLIKKVCAKRLTIIYIQVMLEQV